MNNSLHIDKGDVKVLHFVYRRNIMPTTNPRINVTLEPEFADALAALAAQGGQSLSALAREMILDGIERHEDYALSALAEKRDNKKAKTVKHKNVWK
jgi:predicted DNA-binding protein